MNNITGRTYVKSLLGVNKKRKKGVALERRVITCFTCIHHNDPQFWGGWCRRIANAELIELEKKHRNNCLYYEEVPSKAKSNNEKANEK